VFNQTFCSRTPFGFENNYGSHILGHVNIEYLDDRYPKVKKIYPRNDFTWILTHSNSIRNNTMHYFTLIKLPVAHFVGTGCVLIR